jgi:nucleoside-diphosphate-sugar epimerase
LDASRQLLQGQAGFGDGRAGLLGSFLCERLLGEGAEVLCVDNYFTGRRADIAHLLGNASFEALRHDVTMPLFVEVNAIFNFACLASPMHYQFDPVATTKVSVHGAINMLGLAKRLKCRILQASTSEVYGDPGVHPQHESYWANVNPIVLVHAMTRASAALKRFSSTSEAAPSRDQSDENFQHLRCPHARKRRAGGF